MITKKLVGIIAIAIPLITLYVLKKRSAPKAAGSITIGILQTTSHPALDSTREGFVSYLTKELGDKVHFIIQNAEGSISNAQAMAKSFQMNRNIDAIYAIATPAAQAIAHLEKNRPIFIAAVTDPASLGFVYPGSNVCGKSDMVDVKQQALDIKTRLPHVKTVGILFNPGEANSIIVVKKMKQALAQQGLIAVEIGVNSEAEVPTAVNNALRRSDALLIPTDNTIASALKIVTTLASKAGKPVIASVQEMVAQGALFASGAVDYRTSGEQVGAKALEVLLKGAKPAQLKFD